MTNVSAASKQDGVERDTQSHNEHQNAVTPLPDIVRMDHDAMTKLHPFPSEHTIITIKQSKVWLIGMNAKNERNFCIFHCAQKSKYM